MKLILCLTISLVASTCGAWPWAWPDDVPIFHSIDPLAQRDDTAGCIRVRGPCARTSNWRYSRSVYYWQSGESLCRIPAYVGLCKRRCGGSAITVGPLMAFSPPKSAMQLRGCRKIIR